MKLYRYVLTAALAGIAHTAERPTRLYVASYDGTVSTVQLKAEGLEITHIATECSPTPSWLTLDQQKKLLYCADRGITPGNGTLNTFKASHGGKLVHLSRVPTIQGTVSSVAYGEKDKGLAVAAYQTSTFQTFDVSDPAAPKLQQTWTYTLDKPGPVLPNQEVPHPHQSVLDPTGKYVLVPDLGADIVRLFEVDSRSLLLKPLEPLVALPPGTGPRHVAFHTTKHGKTLLYVLGELANTITTYELSYPSNQPPKVKLLQSTSTFGEGNSAPNGTSAAEVQVTNDGRFVVVSSRNDKTFTLPNFDPKNSTQIVSDSIITFGINAHSGSLKLLQVFPSGGRVPRHIEVNNAGTLVAAGLQADSRVVLIDRDVESGKLKGFKAHIDIVGEIVASIFDE